MKGYEKQIAWAEDIKATVIKTIETLFASLKDNPPPQTNDVKAAQAKVERALEAVKACDNARDLIEVYKGVSSSKSLQENLSIILSRIHNRFRRVYDDSQKPLIGE